jgi:hypothetical protein
MSRTYGHEPSDYPTPTDWPTRKRDVGPFKFLTLIRDSDFLIPFHLLYAF